MMKLFVSGTSPYVRKARMVVLENELSDQVEEIDIKTTPLNTHEGLAEKNPLGKIPCLIHDKGFAIFDSRVICAYLDDKSSKASLHPARNYKHETLIALTDGMLDASVAAAYEKMIRPEKKQFQEWIDSQKNKIRRGLEVVESDFMDVLSHINMGAIGLLCVVEYLDMRHPDIRWRDDFPKISKWYQEFSQRPSALATQPKP